MNRGVRLNLGLSFLLLILAMVFMVFVEGVALTGSQVVLWFGIMATYSAVIASMVKD